RGRRRLPVSDFVQGNRRTDLRGDEILAAVIMPRVGEEAASAFLKLGARRYLVISIAMVAAIVEVEESRVARARIAIGACSPVARRLPDAEASLAGQPADGKLSGRVKAEHLSGLSPISDVRAEAGYRRDAALTLVRRAIDRCIGVAASC
ncbi:MAG: xanthine dehydrogenase family protein subunit M, partial [Parvibaculaceae bacterium]